MTRPHPTDLPDRDPADTPAPPDPTWTAPPWLDRALYPFTPRAHATPDGVMRYVDEGRGRPVLLVHGTPSWSFEWRATIAALAADHRVIAPDHLGFGLSDKPPAAPYRPADHARRLRALVVERLDLSDVTLVVHDFGGPIGLDLAAQVPHRIRRVVVVNSWAWAVHDPRVARIARLVRSPLGRFLYLWLNASPRWLVPAAFADRRRLARRVHRHYTAPFPRRADRRAPWALGAALDDAPRFAALWAARAAWIDKVAAVVWGLRDPALRPELLAVWRAAAPRAAVIALDAAGHFPQEEAPDAVTAAIRDAAR